MGSACYFISIRVPETLVREWKCCDRILQDRSKRNWLLFLKCILRHKKFSSVDISKKTACWFGLYLVLLACENHVMILKMREK